MTGTQRPHCSFTRARICRNPLSNPKFEALVYPPDADETGPTEHEIAETWPFVAPPANDQVN
jgi:hypothetical protein